MDCWPKGAGFKVYVAMMQSYACLTGDLYLFLWLRAGVILRSGVVGAGWVRPMGGQHQAWSTLEWSCMLLHRQVPAQVTARMSKATGRYCASRLAPFLSPSTAPVLQRRA